MFGTGRIGALDGLRGLAAVTVAIFFHYRHFNVADAIVDLPLLMIVPFRWMQAFGWLGVDLFFVLSGYIFAWKYLDQIADRKITGSEFFVLRASRLYPLHLLTLAIVGVEVWAFYLSFNSFPFHSQHNDVFHLVLSAFFAQHIGLDAGHSFNFPAWSLSVEAVCYVLFFWLAVNRRLFWLACPALVLLGLYLLRTGASGVLLTSNVGRGLIGFFIGAILARVLRADYHREVRVFALCVLLFFIATACVVGVKAFPWGEGGINLTMSLAILPSILALSLTIPALSWLLSARPLTFLGDISYSIYLVHVPLQIAILHAFKALGIMPPVTSLLFFGGYAALVLAVGAVCYFSFEVPMRAWVRARYMPQCELPLREASRTQHPPGDGLTYQSGPTGQIADRERQSNIASAAIDMAAPSKA